MNFGDLFDSPWKILIVAIVILVLFGSKKLPHAARSLGQSMRILKTEVNSLHEDEDQDESTVWDSPRNIPTHAELPPRARPDQAQIDALQQQIRDLQRAAATGSEAPAMKAADTAGAQRSEPQ
jgi:sec-independent protein translocase protein TatA